MDGTDSGVTKNVVNDNFGLSVFASKQKPGYYYVGVILEEEDEPLDVYFSKYGLTHLRDRLNQLLPKEE